MGQGFQVNYFWNFNPAIFKDGDYHVNVTIYVKNVTLSSYVNDI